MAYLFRGFQLKGRQYHSPVVDKKVTHAVESLGGEVSKLTKTVYFPRFPHTPEFLKILQKFNTNHIYRFGLYATSGAVLSHVWNMVYPLKAQRVLNVFAGSGFLLYPFECTHLDAIENYPLYTHILNQNPYINLIGEKFFETNITNKYDVIVGQLPVTPKTPEKIIRIVNTYKREGGKVVLIIPHIHAKRLERIYNCKTIPVTRGTYKHITQSQQLTIIPHILTL